MESTFARWITESKNIGFFTCVPDGLVAWGDFLQATGKSDEAKLKYHEAKKEADTYGFKLAAKVADERLAGKQDAYLASLLRR